MKKIALILAVILVTMSTVAYGEIRIDSLTIEQLLELKQSINARIAELSKDVTEEPIGVGNYIVGEDIRASSFEIVYYANDYIPTGVATAVPAGYVRVTDSTTGEDVSSLTLADKDVAYVSLKDGMCLTLGTNAFGNKGKFYIREVTSSWAAN